MRQLLGRDLPPDKTRLSIVTTRFLGDPADAQFWVAQWLLEMTVHFTRHPRRALQAVLALDGADRYAPARSETAAKASILRLLHRGRATGLSLLLSGRAPGEVDPQCCDHIHTWLVGSLPRDRCGSQLESLFAGAGADLAELTAQSSDQFCLVARGTLRALQTPGSAVSPKPLSDAQVLSLAASGRPRAHMPSAGG